MRYGRRHFAVVPSHFHRSSARTMIPGGLRLTGAHHRVGAAMVSRCERRALREIEQHLAQADPEFAALLCGPRPTRRYQIAVGTAIAGVLTALLGLLLFSAILIAGGVCVAFRAWLRIVLMRWAGDD
jgi:hypothetical protein